MQLVRDGKRYHVTWRGVLLKQHGTFNYRAYVYRLDNGFWDCYY